MHDKGVAEWDGAGLFSHCRDSGERSWPRTSPSEQICCVMPVFFHINDHLSLPSIDSAILEVQAVLKSYRINYSSTELM